MVKKLLYWFRQPQPLWRYCLLVALLLTTAYNVTFAKAVQTSLPQGNAVFVVKLLFLLLFLHWFFISLFSLNRLTQWVAATLVLVAAIAVYFENEYGIIIDKSMLQNAVETDVAEVSGLLNSKFFFYLVFYGLLPAGFLLWITIKKQHGFRLLGGWAGRVTIPFLLICLTIFTSYKDFSSYFRNHQSAKYFAAPMNVVMSTSALSRDFIHRWQVPKFDDLTADTHPVVHATGKPRLLVIVVGETARADHFGLNGYSRNTTPMLSRRDILNFDSVSSCGTATAVSVPCMFSWLPRKDYDDATAKHSSNLLDFVTKAGISVLWRDNNSGCKEMCNRVPTENAGQELSDAILCEKFHCRDDILLQNFADEVAALPNGDKLIVLHQLGSHGPEYFKRSAQMEKQFMPECHTSELQNCTADEITNAYDNSIVATDAFLDRTISTLQSLSPQYDTAMVYLSDHGESLGENGLYLHGMPYLFAPASQTHVPMIVWMSDVYKVDEGISENCLRSQTHANISHDNFFHTVLGMFEVEDSHYNAALDIFAPCKHQAGNLLTAG